MQLAYCKTRQFSCVFMYFVISRHTCEQKEVVQEHSVGEHKGTTVVHTDGCILMDRGKKKKKKSTGVANNC